VKQIYERIFEKLKQLGILDVKQHGKRIVEGYMPLSVDQLGTNHYAIAHNYIQNGDVMADPDMEIRVFPEQNMAEALSFQQDNLGIYRTVYPNPKMVNPMAKKDLNAFLDQWLTNLINQGFTEVDWQ